MAMGCAVWGTNAAGVGLYRIGSGDVAINDAVANNAAVINCSFGQTAPLSAAMSNALNNAQNAGVIIVCAAGNDTNNILNSPSAGWAAHAWPIIVSNIQQGTNDTLFPASNFGNPISLAAPGTAIVSTFTTNYTTPAAGGTYGNMTGTSQASPHVAAGAGMVRSMNPNRIAAVGTKSLLFRMAQDLGAPGRDPIYGFGMLQLPASFLSPLKRANTFVGPNPFPFLEDGSYEFPYPNLSDAFSATPLGGTIVLNGGITGTTLNFPAQTLNIPMTLMAFPDHPVSFGN
jgi:subtilisin family serine protease